jgi:membrane-anchored mycosin MYCP
MGKDSTDKDRTYGAVEDYRAQELVVALRHEDLVSKALTDLHVVIGDEDKDKDDRLGLALLPLGNLADAVKPLRQDAELVRKAIAAKWSGGKPDGIELSDLDLLLSKLYAVFSSSYDNWIPEIGKNRLISPVRGLPYISGCAEGDPSQAALDDPDKSADLGWPQPRPAEPGHGVRVGLLDTKLYPHPWLAGGYVAAGPDLLEMTPGPGQQPPWSLDGHATFVAGLILHQAPGAWLITYPALGPRALGRTWDVAKMMADFAGSGVDILNLSFGCYTDDGQPPLVLAKAVSLVSPQILLVAAAGNHGDIEELWKKNDPPPPAWTKNLKDTTPVWPAAFAEVIGVGANVSANVDANDGHNPADFSPKAPWVDVIAPGVDVGSTYPDGEVRLTSPAANPPTKDFKGFAHWKGTSFAAATVSGAVAANIGPGRDAWQALTAVLDDQLRYPAILRV